MQDYIYVLVSQTGTNIAKIIRFFTRKPYNHASISADSNLHEMYSFCRNSPSMPLPATFNQEIVGRGTLGKFSDIPCELYAIPVTRHQRLIFEHELEPGKPIPVTTQIICPSHHIYIMKADLGILASVPFRNSR
mgnify:CR=1 FL=1